MTGTILEIARRAALAGLATLLLVGLDSRPGEAQGASACSATITIRSNGTIAPVAAATCNAGGAMRWTVDNQGADASVSFAFTLLGRSKDPLQTAVKGRSVSKGQGTIVAPLRAANQFGAKGDPACESDATRLCYGTYTYAITVQAAGEELAIDPDLEVTPPPA
jgi:hypothetical protein